MTRYVFVFGVPEKINGWQRYSGIQFLGICRKLHNWIALDQSNYVALGTHLKLYVEEGSQYYDITPVRRTQTLSSGALASTSGSTTIITVTDASHGAVTNDFVNNYGATTFAGIPATELNKEHQITVIDVMVDGGTYSITSRTGWGAGLWGGKC